MISQLKILQELQSAVNQRDQVPSTEIAAIRFQPELLWELLDPSISQVASVDGSMSKDGTSLSTTLHVTTTFIHPIADPDGSTQVPLGSGVLDHSSQTLFDGFDAPFLDDFFSESFLSGIFHSSHPLF